MFSVPKPIHRSHVRQLIGKEYYCFREKLKWRVSGKAFANKLLTQPLPYLYIAHESTLLRKLKDVDMQLQYNKVKNLQLAADRINGVLIRPGETFSIWKLVGRPTASKGYLPGMTLHQGKVGEGIGGGLCQLGNLIYWMALHTPLTITQRWRHSYDVFPDSNRTLPFGSGATLAYNYIDLHLTNYTNAAFQINIWLSEKNLHGTVLSDQPAVLDYHIYEKNHRFELQWWGGYTRHNEIWRKIVDKNEKVIDEEMVTSNHAIMMYNPLLENSSDS